MSLSFSEGTALLVRMCFPFDFPFLSLSFFEGSFLFVRKGELKGVTEGDGSVSKGRNDGSIEREDQRE